MATQSNGVTVIFPRKNSEEKRKMPEIFCTKLASITTSSSNQATGSNITKLSSEDTFKNTCSAYSDLDNEAYEEPTNDPNINNHFDYTIKTPCIDNGHNIVSD